MCKSNYVADNVEKVQHFLIEILNRSSVEEVCVILKHILEFEPHTHLATEDDQLAGHIQT